MSKVNGININYRDEGQGEPLVMIMGLSSVQNSWMFQLVIAALIFIKAKE